MSTSAAPQSPPHVGILRSIACSIEPAFPEAADTLRGVAASLAPSSRDAYLHPISVPKTRETRVFADFLDALLRTRMIDRDTYEAIVNLAESALVAEHESMQ